jgi:hypothetical protein
MSLTEWNMSSDENLRKLGNCITALEEQADKLRKHADDDLPYCMDEEIRASFRT